MKCNVETMKALVGFIGESFGELAEIVLFDAQNSDLPVLTSWNLGFDEEKLREFARAAVHNTHIVANGSTVGNALTLSGGRLGKVSAYFLTNEKETIENILCICVPCDLFLRMSGFVSRMLTFNNGIDTEEQKEPFPGSRKDISLDLIDEIFALNAYDPATAVLNDRLDVICDLYDEGYFDLKGSVARVAEKIQMSEQSVYRYVSKIRKARG